MASNLSRFFAESGGTRFLSPASDPPLGPALKYSRNPIFFAPAPTAHICHPQVVFEAGRFWMFYVHYDEVRPPNACLELATSTDGLEWAVHPDSPVLTPSTDAWDAWRTSYHSIVKVDDIFYLYYTGIQETFKEYGIGLAVGVIRVIHFAVYEPLARDNFPGPVVNGVDDFLFHWGASLGILLAIGAVLAVANWFAWIRWNLPKWLPSVHFGLGYLLGVYLIPV